MILRKCKIFTALFLAFVLTLTPMSLFASVWEGEQGQAFRARPVELMSDTHADWVTEDLEILRDHDILSDDDFYALIAMGVDAALEYYLAPQPLEVFWGPDDNDWAWEPFFEDIWYEEGLALKTQLTELLGEAYAAWITSDIYREFEFGLMDDETFEEILTLDIMAMLSDHLTPEGLAEIMAWDEIDRQDILYDVLWWEILAPMIFNWDWTPGFSGIWFDVGQSLRVQLVDLLGEFYAMWITEDLDWQRNFLGEAVFFEILALDLAEFLAEHMTEEEIEAWQTQEDEWNIYGDLLSLIRSVYLPDWDGGWQRELSPIWQEEGLALKTQLIDILGEDQAIWIAEELDWYNERGLILDDTWTEILTMDIMAALEEYFTDEELAEFLEADDFWRIWDLLDFILEPMIWAGWGDMVEVITREDIAAALEIVAAEHLAHYDFDIVALLDAAELEMEDFITTLHFLLTAGGTDGVMWQVWQWGEDWLYFYIDDMLWSFHWMDEYDIVFLRLFAGVAFMYEILGEDTEAFFELAFFEDISLVFGEEVSANAVFAGPNMEAVLREYGTQLLTILDFRLYDALSELFAAEGDEWPEGLATLDALLSGLLSDNIDILYEFYTEGPPIAIVTTVGLWRYLENWEYLILNEENLEERLAFDVTVNTEFALDLIHIMDQGTHLNLFYANNADSHIYLVIEFTYGGGLLRERIIRVAPGTSATTQLTADELTEADMVWVMIINTEGDEISGEFAFRKTRLPLP
jgi:hypothetical protein